MKKPSLKEKIQYHIELIMEKGTATMILMLLLFTLIASIIAGIIVYIICGGAPGARIWDSFMHTLDAGNLAGDELDSKTNIVFMTIMTLFGLFFTSALVGIINSSFENKLYEMRKGTSKVLEKGHVVILGYNYTVFTLIDSLVEANSNESHKCVVVVVGDEEQEVMEDEIKGHISDFRNTKVICRSGKPYEEHMLDRASVEDAKSVIINGIDDFNSIKSMLAVEAYIENRENELYDENLFVSVVIQEKKFVDAAELAGGKRVQIIYGNDKISRIIAHSCNQRGLCGVFEELFDFADNELYFEDVAEAKGKKFKEVLHMFEAEIPIGIYRDHKSLINPSMDEVIKDGDKLILFEDDNGSFKISNEKNIEEDLIVQNPTIDKSMMDLIILGQNKRLDDILKEYDMIANKESVVKIVDTPDSLEYPLSDYNNIKIKYVKIDEFSLENIRKIPERKEFNVLVLTNDDIDYEDADSYTLIKLIELKKLAEETQNRFATTCEIRKSANQKLAALIGGDNFVVSSNITSLLATQISENRALAEVFDELLTTEGSELYMRPVDSFVKIDKEVCFDTIIESASRNDCIVLGYRKSDVLKDNGIITCPKRNSKIKFNEDDTLIVLAKD